MELEQLRKRLKEAERKSNRAEHDVRNCPYLSEFLY